MEKIRGEDKEGRGGGGRGGVWETQEVRSEGKVMKWERKRGRGGERKGGKEETRGGAEWGVFGL